MSIFELESCGSGMEIRKLLTSFFILKKQIVSIAFSSPDNLSFLKTARPMFCDSLSPVIGLSFDFEFDSSVDCKVDVLLLDVFTPS